ncbi:Uncharacterised protein [Vibrio cholerae]|uniref:Uncharacterized protein n=1 Tax=Vibrio cholerae TaxID=666 RepID=A0A655YJI1_VIBCL|nr:Uncharacterised protein [Vibrio cholerae]
MNVAPIQQTGVQYAAICAEQSVQTLHRHNDKLSRRHGIGFEDVWRSHG